MCDESRNQLRGACLIGLGVIVGSWALAAVSPGASDAALLDALVGSCAQCKVAVTDDYCERQQDPCSGTGDNCNMDTWEQPCDPESGDELKDQQGDYTLSWEDCVSTYDHGECSWGDDECYVYKTTGTNTCPGGIAHKTQDGCQ